MTIAAQHVVTEQPFAPPIIKALLLDDSTFDRARIRRISAKMNMAIHLDEVSSIVEMEQKLQEENYDLILLDYYLPTGDGLAAVERIKMIPQNRNAAMVMISGQAGMATAVTAMRRGCHDVLVKDGLTSEKLRQTVTDALQSAQRQRQMLALAQEGDRARSQGPSGPYAAPPHASREDIEAIAVMIAELDEDDEFVFH